ncbi:MAG: AhpC/TSA family protein [Bacteroidetes bacterium]|nr:AhpC/TSA family protein [Bacteroidota bacterium]MBS1929653.1 AhpC/TSA family protein [Bacteroidota bacterium]
MKKTTNLFIYSALTLSAFMFGCGQKNDNKSYSIKGTITGIDSGLVKLVRNNMDDRTSTTMDSARFSNGKFSLQGTVSGPEVMTVVIKPGNWSFQVFVENTLLNITADTTGSDHFDYTMYGGGKSARINKFTETGSNNFTNWMEYQNDPEQKKYDAVFADLAKKIETTKDIDEQYRYRDQVDSVRKLLNEWQESKIQDYISKNPSSVAGAYMLNNLYLWFSDLPFDDMQNMVAKFKGEAKQSKYYTSLKDILEKRKAVMPGSIAPDFTLLKRDSSKFTLSSSRGKYMMIDFWASWCHPCRKAIPHWKEVYQKYNDKGFEIVSVSDDSRWKDWFKAMDEEKMPWTQVCDEFPVKNMPAKVGSLYMTTYIPFYVLLDKEGKILVYSADENKIGEKLKEVFGG